MNVGKHFISIKLDRLTTGNIMAEIGVMQPLSVDTWVYIYMMDGALGIAEDRHPL